MRRLICASLLALLAGLVVPATPAHAATALTIHASRSALMAGSTTSIYGSDRGAPLGTTIRLQRKVSGTWTTARSKKLGAAGTYRFAVVPPRGFQYFRVVESGGIGRPGKVSSVVRLTVRWDPTLTATATDLADPTHGQTIRLRGKVTDGPVSPVLCFERKDPAGWTTLSCRVVQLGVVSTFERTAAPGPAYRLRLRRTALTTQQVTTSFVHAVAPLTVEMNSALSIMNLEPSTDTAALVRVQATSGDYVTVKATSSAGPFRVTVIAPSGLQVGMLHSFPQPDLTRFVAPESGTYTIAIDQVGSTIAQLNLFVSTPKVVTTQIDAAVTVSSDLPGQPVDVRFDTTGTSRFTLPGRLTTDDDLTVLDPAGAEVSPWLPEKQTYRDPVYRASGGTYTLHIAPQNAVIDAAVDPRSVTTVSATVGEFTDAVIDVPRRVVLLQFPRPTQHVTVGTPSGYNVSADSFDAETGAPDPTGPGTTVVAVSAYQDQTVTVPIQLSTPYDVPVVLDGPAVHVDLTPSYVRQIAVRFTAAAGQLVTSHVVTDGSGWLRGLTGPDGSTVPNHLLGRGLWTIPSDGEYTLTMDEDGDWKGTVAVETVATTTLPGDGTPTTITIAKPGQMIMATVPVPSGSIVDATLDQISNHMGSTWSVGVYKPDMSYWYNSWGVPGTLPPIVVRDPGDLVAIVTAEQSGSLRLAFAPRT